MTRPSAVAAVLVASVLAVGALGGCRSGDPVGGVPGTDPGTAVESQDPVGGAPGTDPGTAVESQDPVGGAPGTDPGTAVESQDPLGDIESTLDAVERELDADSG